MFCDCEPIRNADIEDCFRRGRICAAVTSLSGDIPAIIRAVRACPGHNRHPNSSMRWTK